MQWSWTLLVVFTLTAYLFYWFFLSFFIEYFYAGTKLGFDKIAMIYKPLSTFNGIFKEGVKKHNYCYGLMMQKVNKNPNIKIILVRVFGITQYTIVDPQYIKKLSFDFLGNLNKRQFLVFASELKYGLIFAEGQEWKKSRKILSGLFHFNILQARQNIMEEVILKKITHLQKQNPDLFKLGCLIGGEIVLKSLFGYDFYKVEFNGKTPQEEMNQLLTQLIRTTRGFRNICRLIIGKRVTKDSKYLSSQQKKVLERLLIFKQKCTDFLKIQKKKYQQGETMPQFLKAYFDLNQPDFQETVQQLFLFLMAGQDTTGSLISYCLLYLALYPQYQESILQDVQKSGVHNSKQLNNFISEVNRKCAPVQNSLSRKVISPFSIDGYTFKKGSALFLAYFAAMNNIKYWDQPQKFNPSRFNTALQYPSAYTPFSNGPRNCIGQHMALMEIRLTIVRVLQNYTLKKDGDPGPVNSKGVVSIHQNLKSVKFIPKKVM